MRLMTLMRLFVASVGPFETWARCQAQISERHRHRYEFNNRFRQAFEEHGMVLSGVSPDGLLVEMMELKDHPFMIASQFHPEFLSRPNRPHPLFTGLIHSICQLKGLAGDIIPPADLA